MDILLQKFFEKDRWEKAIDTGVGKHIDKGELRKLTCPDTRVRLYKAIATDNYAISPPHVALIPKDTPGEFREVMICENIDRIVLSIINNLFFEMFPEYIHDYITCRFFESAPRGDSRKQIELIFIEAVLNEQINITIVIFCKQVMTTCCNT